MFEALVLTPLVAYRQQPFVESGRWLVLAMNLPLLRSMIAIARPRCGCDGRQAARIGGLWRGARPSRTIKRGKVR